MAEYYGNICTCRKCNGIVHTIKRGDTLYLLSRYYNVTINEIMRANANINVYNLQIGDQICIPVRRPAPTPSQPSNRPEMGMNQPQNPPQQRPDGSGRPSMIQPRDNEDRNNDNRNNSLDDLIEDLLEDNDNQDRTQLGDMMGNSIEAEAMQVSTAETFASSSCCGGMKIKDVLKDEEMTLEELARMLKNM